MFKLAYPGIKKKILYYTYIHNHKTSTFAHTLFILPPHKNKGIYIFFICIAPSLICSVDMWGTLPALDSCTSATWERDIISRTLQWVHRRQVGGSFLHGERGTCMADRKYAALLLATDSHVVAEDVSVKAVPALMLK